MSENTYTAVTIGPIYKTLSLAKKTRELWGASYLFSFIMRRLIEGLKDTSKCCLPYHHDLLKEGIGNGAGLFPDRLIYVTDVKEKVVIIEAIILKEIADKTELPLDYLQNYIRIYAITYSLPTCVNEDNDKNNNIVIVANRLLDTIELQEKLYSKNISEIDWKSAIDKINGRLFYKEAFNKEKQFQFPSIVEIATDDYRQKNKGKYYELVSQYLKDQEVNDQREFLKRLSASNEFAPIKMRPYHNYIAVVQADGDNIGKTIGKIGDKVETVKDFSAALFEFAMEAQKRIKNFGGKAVYIGGDDLLFFAPVAICFDNQDFPSLKSIFGLINEIDKAFDEKIIHSEKLKHLYQKNGILEMATPSMSYGVSITYSKYPLKRSEGQCLSFTR